MAWIHRFVPRVEALEARDCPSATPTLATVLRDIAATTPTALQLNRDVVNHNRALLEQDLSRLSKHSEKFLADFAAAAHQSWTKAAKGLVIKECLLTFRDAERHLPRTLAIDLAKFDRDFRRLVAPLQTPGPRGERFAKDVHTYLRSFSNRMVALEHDQLANADRHLRAQGDAQKALVIDVLSPQSRG